MEPRFKTCDDPGCRYCNAAYNPAPEPIGNYMGGGLQLITKNMYDKVVAERDKAQEDAEYWRHSYEALNKLVAQHKCEQPQAEHHEFAEHQRTINDLSIEAATWKAQYESLRQALDEESKSLCQYHDAEIIKLRNTVHVLAGMLSNVYDTKY